jgi:hypothetical protein
MWLVIKKEHIMAEIKDLALVKFAKDILKSAKGKFEKFMEHKEPQTYEEYKKSWEKDDSKKIPTPTPTKVAKEVLKPKIEQKQEKSVTRKEPKTKPPKKTTPAKVKTPKKSVTKKTSTEKKSTPVKKTSTEKKSTPVKKATTEKKTTPVKKVTTEKKTTPVKKVTTEKKTTTKKVQAGSKKEAKIKLYTQDVKKHYGSVDANFLEIIVKNLGPSIYKKDAEAVSCSDPKELDTVRKNFCIKKLGFDKSETKMLDIEIKKVCDTMKSSKIKYRATFYYILAKNLKKESALN